MISIVMPTYNQSKFINQTIQSILAQSFTDWELVIVDDGSKDKTPEICKSYADFYENIHYFRKENGGTGSALNYGFERTKGDYETWFASDNILYPRALERLNWFLDNHEDVDYVYANIEIGVMDASGLVEKERHNITREIKQEWNPKLLMEHYFLGIVWLWRKSLRLSVGPFQKEPCEDYDMVLRMFDAGGRFAYLPECLGWFRRHEENLTRRIAKSGNKDRYSYYVHAKAEQRRAKK